VLDESLPNYIGMYDGKLMNEDVRAFVEGCDLVIGIGASLTDFNSGSFTASIDRSKSVNILHHGVRVGEAVYNNVEMKDILGALTAKASRKDVRSFKTPGLGKPVGAGRQDNGRVSLRSLGRRTSSLLRPGRARWGWASPTFHNQTLWGSIGWATPASFGGALAAPDRRAILITGEGSHQLTAQEVSQFYRFGLKPIIFVLNNDGYLIERLLCKNPEVYYNDLARWHYHKLPEALGCDDWLTARVATCGELDEIIKKAEAHAAGAYIEVVTDRYAASPLARRLRDSVATLYA
jgi:indolepyruvate decarboxylase